MCHFTVKITPRKYQYDALEKAKERNCIICLPTGGGKTLVGLMYACYLLNEKKAGRVLILEPTRFLVTQTAEYYKKNSDIPTTMLCGTIPKEERIKLWNNGKVVVTTPQTAYNDKECLDFDAVIIDECHHTTGDHAYAKLMQGHNFTYKLGLSATIPRNREEEIKRYIGDVFTWSLSHPEIKEYIPEWYGEVYDSGFDEKYQAVYNRIMEIRKSFEGSSAEGLCSTAIRMLCRDGAIALRETLEKENMISTLLKEELYDALLKCDDAHKLEAMKKILAQHEFNKAIVFVDRVILARILSESFKDLNPVQILGKMYSSEDAQNKAVNDASDRGVKLVISTSAGEEGVNLPSADLLIVWSNTVSVVRFIQRTGRLLRRSDESPETLKIAAYISTPDTPDYDALWHGICAAAEAGVEVPGIDKEALSRGLVIERVSHYLEFNPRPYMDIVKDLNIRKKDADSWLKENVNRGKVFYFYLFPFDPEKKAKAIRNIKEGNFDDDLLDDLEGFNKSFRKWGINLSPERFVHWIRDECYGSKRIAIFLNYVCSRVTRENRTYALQDEASIVLNDYSEFFAVPPDFSFTLSYGFSNKKNEHEVYGTPDKIVAEVLDAIVEKKVYLHFSSRGLYAGSKVDYSGIYSKDALKLIIKNAGWICWRIKRMNEIIGS